MLNPCSITTWLVSSWAKQKWMECPFSSRYILNTWNCTFVPPVLGSGACSSPTEYFQTILFRVKILHTVFEKPPFHAALLHLLFFSSRENSIVRCVFYKLCDMLSLFLILIMKSTPFSLVKLLFISAALWTSAMLPPTYLQGLLSLCSVCSHHCMAHGEA